ncbi:MAG: hypothetical protein ACRC2K_01350 [Clostridium sp.]
MFNFIMCNFTGTFIIAITQSGNVAFGEVLYNCRTIPPVIPLRSGITTYVNADAIDFFF